jgi:dipeptidyl aminopeptidase/acylaminoacyl peptidase
MFEPKAVVAALCAVPLAVACRTPRAVTLASVTSAAPGASAAVIAPGAAPPAGAPKPYLGHGSESVSPADLETYRPRPLPPEVTRRIQSLMDVRAPGIGALAPDGKAMFFSWSITGTGQVWRLDGPKRFPRELTGGEDGTSLAAVTPDGRSLVLQRDRKGEENPGLYLQPVAGGPLEVIQHERGTQARFEVVSGDSRYVYFTSNDRKPDSYVVYRYDVAKKAKEVVFAGEDGLWHVSDLRDPTAEHPGVRLLLRKETGSLTAEYFEYDTGKSSLTPLLGQGEKEEYDARYGAREGSLVVLTNKLGEFRRLYAWSGGKLEPVGDALEADVDAFDVDRRRTHVVYTTNEGGFTRPHALDARTLRPVKLPALPEADHVTFGPTTPDGRFTTMGVDDGRHPLQGYVLDWTTGRTEAWHAPSTPETDTTKFARASIDAYAARDGTKVPVLVRRPERCQEGTLCPVVVSFHGGPEGQARPGFSVGAQMFVDAGFVYVEPNVRGSDGYGKSWQHADDGPRRLDVITDIEDAARWARAKFAAKGEAPKVGIYGGSYGGYSVLVGMTMFAGAYDAGVDVVGISDLRTFLRNTAPYRRVLRMSEYGDPDRAADADALAKLSPMTYVDRVKAPILIMQGASDPRVPAGEAIQIHDALAGKGVPCELMIFPDEGHGAQKRENRVLMIGHAIRFFTERLR